MAQTVSPVVNSTDREHLAAVVEDRNRPQKHVQRARLILLSAERLTVLEVAARSGASRPSVWRWQRRFAEEGVAGLLRDKTRKPGRAPLPPATIAKILALPCGKPPKAATHWTGRAVANAVAVSLSAVATHLAGPSLAAIAKYKELVLDRPVGAPHRRERPRSRAVDGVNAAFRSIRARCNAGCRSMRQEGLEDMQVGDVAESLVQKPHGARAGREAGR